MPALAICAVLSTLAGCGSSQQSSPNRTNATVSDRPSFSGVIAFRRFFDDAHHSGAIFTIGADGRGERQVSHPPSGMVDSLNGPPAFTPDGSAFIFDRTDANGNGSLWRVQADGSHEHRIPSLGGMPGDGWPTLSPDGHRDRGRPSMGEAGRPRGPEDRPVHPAPGRLITAACRSVRLQGGRGRGDVVARRANARFAVFNNGPGRPANASALFAVFADGRGLRRITTWDTTGVISSPAFSPDGELVLFHIKPEGRGLGGNYYTIHPDGTDRRKLTNFPIGSILGSARWSRDGRWIVFANSGTAGNDDLFIMRANGSHIALTRTAAWESAPTSGSLTRRRSERHAASPSDSHGEADRPGNVRPCAHNRSIDSTLDTEEDRMRKVIGLGLLVGVASFCHGRDGAGVGCDRLRADRRRHVRRPAGVPQHSRCPDHRAGTVLGTADTTIADPNYPNFNPFLVGFADPVVPHAFEWRDGKLKDLGALPGNNGSAVFQINRAGVGAGLSGTGAIDPVTGYPAEHAVLFQHGTVTDLGTLPGGQESSHCDQ